MRNSAVSAISGKPRILILNWRDLRNPLAGGGEVHVWRVFQEAIRQGWDVQALCCGHPGAPQYEVVDGIPVTRCGSELTYPAHVPLAYARLRRTYKPDLVFEVMDKLPLMTPLYVREPTVCFLHHFFGKAAWLEASAPIALAVTTAERMVPYVYRKTPFMTGSPSATQELLDMGIHTHQTTTLCYGVDQDQLGTTAKTPWPSLVYVGRLRQYKHVDHLLRAAGKLVADLPDLRVDIVGSGDAQASLEGLAASLGFRDRVTFHGHVTADERCELMGRAWTGCMPSMKEGFGLTIPEAALCGTPTVGYDVPGVCDAIKHGVTGLLARYGDEAGLTAALRRVLTDAELRARLTAQAMQTYAAFTWDNAAAATLAALQDQIHLCAAARKTRADKVMEATCTVQSEKVTVGTGSAVL